MLKLQTLLSFYRHKKLPGIKYDFAQQDPIPYLNSRKIEDFCKKILACANDPAALNAEVQKIMEVLNSHVSDLKDKDNVKSAPLVEELKKEYFTTNP